MAEQESPLTGQKHAGGRPRKLTALEQAEVYDELNAYITANEDPTIVSFVSDNNVAIQYNVTRDNIEDWQEFSTLIKRATTKQESYLIKNAGSNKYNPTFAIFRLKQPVHGWTDRIQQDLTTNGKDLPTPILGNVNVQPDNSDTQNLIP